ncbi:hypothetical protein [Microvirga flavescens]|nr:hypothetical protein [Microvirga flavescens]
MSVLLIGVVFISSTCLVSIPLIRMWGLPPDEIRTGHAGPTLAPR